MTSRRWRSNGPVRHLTGWWRRQASAVIQSNVSLTARWKCQRSTLHEARRNVWALPTNWRSCVPGLRRCDTLQTSCNMSNSVLRNQNRIYTNWKKLWNIMDYNNFFHCNVFHNKNLELSSHNIFAIPACTFSYAPTTITGSFSAMPACIPDGAKIDALWLCAFSRAALMQRRMHPFATCCVPKEGWMHAGAASCAPTQRKMQVGSAHCAWRQWKKARGHCAPPKDETKGVRLPCCAHSAQVPELLDRTGLHGIQVIGIPSTTHAQ